MSAAAAAAARPRERVAAGAPGWWPLAALVLLAAALRLSTLGLQSFWFDEAFTPVHVLHPSLFRTLDSLTKTENSPPLWYIVEWGSYRLFGTGEWALRLPSALAGIALVPVAWGIGSELAGRAAAIGTAAIVAVGPIFVWYSQEARVYGLYAFVSGLAILCFLRLLAEPEDRHRVIGFALAGALALLTHYFTVFLLAGMVLWLLAGRAGTLARRRALPAIGVIVLVGFALIPLIASQGARNTNWIGEWALTSRLEAIPQYFLTGYNGAPLGHSIELLVALPLLAACGFGLWRMLDVPAGSPPPVEDAPHRRGAALALWLSACGFLIPLGLALAGADYLAPRNVIGAMVPLAALIAVLGSWPRTGAPGAALLALGVLGLFAITIDIDLSPRLQRADWRGIVRELPPGGPERAYTTPLIGSAPLEHYIGGLRRLEPHVLMAVREIVATGEGPLPARARRPPTGFRLLESRRANGIFALRFVATAPRTLSEEQLRRDAIERHEAWVLAPGNARTSR